MWFVCRQHKLGILNQFGLDNPLRSPARVAKELQELEQLRKDKERLEGGVEAELEGMRQQCKRELEEARVQHLANVEVRTAFVAAFTLLFSLLLSSCSCGLLARSIDSASLTLGCPL